MKLSLKMIDGSNVKAVFELEPDESSLEAAYLLDYLTTGRLNAHVLEAISEFGKETLRVGEASRVMKTWSDIKASETPCVKPTDVLRMLHGQE